MVYLQCVDASGQSRLVEGAVYNLILDITASYAPGEMRNKSGYLVGMDGLALPYVFRRTRFQRVDSPVPVSEGEEGA